MRRSAAIMACLGLAFDVPAVHAGGYYSSYGYGNSGYYYPSYYPSYPSYNNYYNYYQVQPVVVQSNLVPAYVFQSAAALTPPVTTSTTVTTNRTTSTTTTTAAQTQAAVATQSAGVVAAGSNAALAVGGGGAVQARQATLAASSASPCAATESRLAALEARLASLSRSAEDEPPTLAAESLTDRPKVYEQPSAGSDDQQAQAIMAALQNSCLPCHSAASHKGNVTLFDAAGQFAPSVDARTILDAVSGPEPRMPKGKPPLDPAVVQALERLVAPEGR